MKLSMPQALLIEETGDRALGRLDQLLTLVLLCFAEAEARAHAIAGADPSRIIDPVASACLLEARELLLRPAKTSAGLRAGLFAALFALDAAASREPECYGPVHQAIRALALDALDEVIALELAGSLGVELQAEQPAGERMSN